MKMTTNHDSSKTASPVEVSVQSFNKFFAESTFPIAVDSYQRGFVWNREKVAEARQVKQGMMQELLTERIRLV